MAYLVLWLLEQTTVLVVLVREIFVPTGDKTKVHWPIRNYYSDKQRFAVR